MKFFYTALCVSLVSAFFSPPARADYTLTTLANLNNASGNHPYSGLAADAAGNLYGTTGIGGAYNDGTIFEVASGTHKLSVLVSFDGANGSTPGDRVVVDSAGNIFGTTAGGGDLTVNQGRGYGSVFEIPSSTHVLSTLATFNGNNGGYPGALLEDAAGNLYGTTSQGGANDFDPPNYRSGDGTIYKIAAGTHTLTTLTSFDFAHGTGPLGSLISDAAGNLYGTTSLAGPTGGQGTVYELKAGSPTVTTLAEFQAFQPEGSYLRGGLVADAAGNLYGTTQWGGIDNGEGTVFKLDAITHDITTLATFNGANGAYPLSSLYCDPSGNLFGTTSYGGPSLYDGTVFEIPAGTQTLLTLVNFNGSNGAEPYGQLIADSAGNLYGTTFIGGDLTQNNGYGTGTVFELSPSVPEPHNLAALLACSIPFISRRSGNSKHKAF
jgi:uncharacterized repeat protein (TIGR03803 family)